MDKIGLDKVELLPGASKERRAGDVTPLDGNAWRASREKKQRKENVGNNQKNESFIPLIRGGFFSKHGDATRQNVAAMKVDMPPFLNETDTKLHGFVFVIYTAEQVHVCRIC